MWPCGGAYGDDSDRPGYREAFRRDPDDLSAGQLPRCHAALPGPDGPGTRPDLPPAAAGGRPRPVWEMAGVSGWARSEPLCHANAAGALQPRARLAAESRAIDGKGVAQYRRAG